MSDGFRKVKLSLVLRVILILSIHRLKAQIFVFLKMYGRSYPDLILRKIDFKTYFFNFNF